MLATANLSPRAYLLINKNQRTSNGGFIGDLRQGTLGDSGPFSVVTNR
jgi:hypothetical protein